MQFFIHVCFVVLYVSVMAATPVTGEDSNGLNDVKATLAIENLGVQMSDAGECVEKFVCTFAALPEPKFNQHLNNPLSIFVKIATDTNQDNESPLYLEARKLLTKYAKFEELLLAAEIGDSMKDGDKCSETYPECPLDRTKIMAMINDEGKLTNLSANNPLREVFTDVLNGDRMAFPSHDRRVKRCSRGASTGCNVGKGVCYTTGATCLLCSWFTFGLCGLACAKATIISCKATSIGCGNARC